ncbi:MAG: 30S ribosomal protein S8 [Fimbriimonadaceae bacterium]
MENKCLPATSKSKSWKILEARRFCEKSREMLTDSKFPTMRVHLKYDSRRKPVIHRIQRVSKPGLRVYRAANELQPLRSGLTTLAHNEPRRHDRPGSPPPQDRW